MIARSTCCLALAAAAALAGCDLLEPRASDDRLDAAPVPFQPDAALPDATPGAPLFVLPPGAEVPSIADDPELATQIRIFDGLSDSTLEMNGGVIVRGTGKAAGDTVRFWDFGAAPMEGNFAVKAPVYLLADDEGEGVFTPRADHPWLIDSIPGDPRYSAMRQIVWVPVTAAYGGELLTSVDALAEAFELGLIGEPVPSGTWRNMPVVVTGTHLELGGVEDPLAATEVFGRGHRVELFPLGIEQPLRNNLVPVGQESRLLSGVETGDPPTLPTSTDSQPVFQYGVPSMPPTTAFNYTPLATALEVRLANGVGPAAIDADADLFARSSSGSITAYRTDNVASYLVTTTVTNRQIQFAEGAP
jgi:hypothetical protein